MIFLDQTEEVFWNQEKLSCAFPPFQYLWSERFQMGNFALGNIALFHRLPGVHSLTTLRCLSDPSFQGLCLCLDFQFDTVVKDRPTILSKLLLLHFLKQDIPALSWEFFVNRFETLSLEAQLHLDCNKEFPFPTSKWDKRLAVNSPSTIFFFFFFFGQVSRWPSTCSLFPTWKRMSWPHVLSSSTVECLWC